MDDDGNGGWIIKRNSSTDRKEGQSEEDLKMPNREPEKDHTESPMVEVMVGGRATKGAKGESTNPAKREDALKAEKDDDVSKKNDRSWRTFKGCVDSVPTLCYH